MTKKKPLVPIIKIEKVPLGDWHYYCWTLSLTRNNRNVKYFPLGQDVKFINRIINDEPDNFIKRFAQKYKIAKPVDLTKKTNLVKLANFILNELEIAPSDLMKREPWALSCQ